MLVKGLQFVAIVAIALSLVPAGAHLLEMPNKMGMEREDYLVVQNLYRGWALAGIPLLTALVACLALAIRAFGQFPAFIWSSLAFVLMLGTLATFLVRILPVNKQTQNWSLAPANWRALRAQWEYTHALNAILTLLALGAMMTAVLVWAD